MSVNSVGPSGGTASNTDPLSGISTTGGTTITGDIATLLQTLTSIVSAFDDVSGTDSTEGGQNGPILPTPPSIPLNVLLSTLNTMRANLSESIQQSTASDIGILQALFKQYLAANPGALAAGTATSGQADALAQLFDNFQSWLQTLNTKDNGILANTLLMALRLLPDTYTPSSSQNFADSSGASGSSALSLTVATQTQSGIGVNYFRQIIIALFQELIQSKILTGGAEAINQIQVNFTPGTETPEDRIIDQLQQALIVLIIRASALSNIASLSLLKDANVTTLQNPQIGDLTKSVAVLATFLNLLRPESTSAALNELASIAGIHLAQLTPENAARISAELARFLQQALITAGLTAFFQALKQLLSQKQPPENVQAQILGLSQRVADLGQALNGAPITSTTLAETLTAFQAVIAGNPNTQAAVTTALTGLFQSSLQGGGVAQANAATQGSALSQQVINLFAQKAPVTADQIQNLLSQQARLSAELQHTLTNQVLTLAASVATQQHIQQNLIQGGAATAASQFSAQTAQVLFGFSVDLLTGGVTQGSVSTTTPSVVQIAPTAPIGPEGPIGPQGSFNRSKDVNVNLGTFLLKLMEPASVVLQLASPIMYGGPQTSIAGNRNLDRPNVGP